MQLSKTNRASCTISLALSRRSSRRYSKYTKRLCFLSGYVLIRSGGVCERTILPKMSLRDNIHFARFREWRNQHKQQFKSVDFAFRVKVGAVSSRSLLLGSCPIFLFGHLYLPFLRGCCPRGRSALYGFGPDLGLGVNGRRTGSVASGQGIFLDFAL